MAYTAYRTWTTGEIVTAALMNEQVRDNGLLTAPAIMTTAGDIMYASAANTPARLAKSTSSTRVLTNTGTSNVPAWAQVTLTSGVTGTLPVANGGTNLTSLGSGVATFMGTPSSANLRGALTDETGTGAAVFASSPTLVTPALGTPASGVLTNATGLPEAGLAVSNSPTNGYMLTAQSGDAGGMTWAAASSGLAAVSQAEMESASSNTVAATPGRTQYHPGVAKAFASINQAGTLQQNYNIETVTVGGTGDRTIVWDTNFTSTDYTIVSSIGGDDTESGGFSSAAVGSVRLYTTVNGSLANLSVYLAAFGEQVDE